MARSITQRELRNQSGEIMRDLDRGESFVVTRNGVPVGELVPTKHRQFAPRETVRAAMQGAPRMDSGRLRRDLEADIDWDPTPRG